MEVIIISLQVEEDLNFIRFACQFPKIVKRINVTFEIIFVSVFSRGVCECLCIDSSEILHLGVQIGF